MQGNHVEAESLARQAFGRTGESGDPWASSMMLVLLANVALWRGELDAALEHGERARRRFREIENVWGEVQSTMPIAIALLALGRAADAREETRRVTAIAEQLNDSMRNTTAALEAAIVVRLGDADALAVVTAAVHPELLTFEDFKLAVGLANLQAGVVDEAIAALSEALGNARQSGVGAALAAVLGLAYVAAGRVDEALSLYEERAGGAITYLDRIDFALLRAFASLRQGNAEEARVAVDDAVAIADTTQARLDQAVTRLARASVLDAMQAGDAATARNDAEQRLHEIGIDAVGWRRLFALLSHP
jgi:tetratricopeptide (TPR) repeat protein